MTDIVTSPPTAQQISDYIAAHTTQAAKATQNVKIELGLSPFDASHPTAGNDQTFDRTNPATYEFLTEATIYNSVGTAQHLAIFYVRTDNANDCQGSAKWQTHAFINERELGAIPQPATNGAKQLLYINSNGDIINNPIGLDPTFNTSAISPLYYRDDQGTKLASLPASVIGGRIEASGFDFGDTDAISVTIITDPACYKQTREGGQVIKNPPYWGTDMFSISVDGSAPQNISIRPGSYSGTQLAAEITRAVNEKFSGQQFYRITDTSRDASGAMIYGNDILRLNLSRLTEDGTCQPMTDPIEIDLLGKAGSYGNSTLLEAREASVQLTREQLITTIQAKLNDALNARHLEFGKTENWLDSSNPPITVGYDIATCALTFTVSTSQLGPDANDPEGRFNSIQVYNPTEAINNLGIPTQSISPETLVRNNATWQGSAAVPSGDPILDPSQQRTGVTVTYNKDTRQFVFISCSSGEASSIIVSRPSLAGTDELQPQVNSYSLANIDFSKSQTVWLELNGSSLAYGYSPLAGNTPTESRIFINDLENAIKFKFGNIISISCNGDSLEVTGNPNGQGFQFNLQLNGINQVMTPIGSPNSTSKSGLSIGEAISSNYLGSNDLLGIGVKYEGQQTSSPGFGLSSTAATAIGTSAEIDMKQIFTLDQSLGENKILFSVDGISGTINLPNNSYDGESLASYIQTYLNNTQDQASGRVISGVTVEFDQIENRLIFKSGTTGSYSNVYIVGCAELGLLNTINNPGTTTSVPNLVQAVDAQGNKLFIDNNGVISTLPPVSLQDWFPLYLKSEQLSEDYLGSFKGQSNIVKYAPIESQDGADPLQISVTYTDSFLTYFPYGTKSRGVAIWQDGNPIYTSSDAPIDIPVNTRVLAASNKAHTDQNGEIDIAVNLVCSVDDVHIEISSESGLLVRTIDLGPKRPGILSTHWNGTDESGIKVAAGFYCFKATTTIDGSDLYTQTYEYGVVQASHVSGFNVDPIITVSNIGDVSISDVLAYKFSPGLPAPLDLLGKTVLVPGNVAIPDSMGRISGAIDVPAASGGISLQIFSNWGVVEKSIDIGFTRSGLTTFQWDGKDDSGNSLTSNFYYVRAVSSDGIYITDLATYVYGRVSAVQTPSVGTRPTVTVDGVGVALVSDIQTIKSSKFPLTSTLIGEKALFQANLATLDELGGISGAVDLLNDCQDLEIQIRTEQGVVVKNIDMGANSAGLVGFQWDGRTENGVPVGGSAFRVTAWMVASGSIKPAIVDVYGLMTAANVTSDGTPDTVTILGYGEIKGSEIREYRLGRTYGPCVMISSEKSDLNPGEATTINFKFSTSPIGFAANDIVANGGVLSDLSVSPSDPALYTARFTRSSDSIVNTSSIAVTTDYADVYGNQAKPGNTLSFVQPPPTPDPSNTGEVPADPPPILDDPATQALYIMYASDSNGDGQISLHEFQYTGGDSATFVAVDANSDGALVLEELQADIQAIQQAQSILSQYDTSCKGYIDANDLEAALSAADPASLPAVIRAEAQQVMSFWDSDADGKVMIEEVIQRIKASGYVGGQPVATPPPTELQSFRSTQYPVLVDGNFANPVLQTLYPSVWSCSFDVARSPIIGSVAGNSASLPTGADLCQWLDKSFPNATYEIDFSARATSSQSVELVFGVQQRFGIDPKVLSALGFLKQETLPGDGTWVPEKFIFSVDSPSFSVNEFFVCNSYYNAPPTGTLANSVNPAGTFIEVANFTLKVVSPFSSGAACSTLENVSTSTAIYTARATNPDGNTTLSYSISGGADASQFNIDASTGAVTFKCSPNFEVPTDSGANNVYDIIVRASDGSLTVTQSIGITVNDVNEAPRITAPGSASTPENISVSTAVYSATTTDPDANTQLVYSLSGGADAALFNINSSTGAVVFKTAPNFEAPTDSGANNVYDIIINVSDGSLTATKPVAINVTDVPESTIASLHGMTYFWKPDSSGKHALLSDVTVSAIGGPGPTEGVNAPIQVRNIGWDSTGHVTADIYAHITMGMDAFDLKFNIGSGTNAAFTSALDTSWAMLNNPTTSPFLVSGYSLTGLGSGDLKLGSLTFDVGTASQAHIGVNSGSDVCFKDVSTKSTAFAYDLVHSTTGSDGSFTFSSAVSGTYALSATRDIADNGDSITAADALSALKIAVAINPNATVNGQQLAVSPFQFMAADVNGDGRVTSADALAILKMAVHLTGAITPQWMFVEDTRDFYDDANGVFTLNRSNASWDHSINANVVGDTSENLVGIIKGDVNGSWTPPAGSSYVETLQPSYFTTLANTIHAPISEFGFL